MKKRPSTSLLEAKLFPGAGASDPIPRPRLAPPAAMLNGQCSVASIVAPAGYGKSTLMTHWLEELRAAGIAAGWLSLDEDDNDSARLLGYLIAALQVRDASIGRDAIAQMGSEFSGTVTGSLLESLAADLAVDSGRLVLFIDDLHCLHNAEAVRIVEWLINYAPRHVQFVLGGRELSHIRLSGLRLRGLLFELDQRHLMFDMEEASRFCGSRLGQLLDASALAQLMEKTEGWPAGLQLAALALQGEEHQEHLIDAFTGSDRGVVEYLGDVVLNRLDDDTRRFLYLAAQFDRISGTLAMAATGLVDAQERLAKLHDRGLFLIALDRHGEWFRFHHLAGEFFRRRTPPGVSAEIAADALMRGAQWLHAESHVEEAINCAIRARRWEQACTWLSERIEQTSHSRGSHQVVFRWMHEIPQEWVDRFPLIPVHYAFSLAFSQRHEEADRQLLRLEGLLSENAPGQPTRNAGSLDEVRCAVEQQRVLLMALRDAGVEARDAARRWLDRWPGATLVQRGTGENVLAFGLKCCGEVSEGLALNAVARQTLLRGDHYYGLAWNAIVEALLFLKQGNYVTARASCERGLRLVSEHLGGGGALRSLYHVIQAAVAYEFDEIPISLAEMERGLVNLEESAPADLLILAYLTQARLMMHAGSADAAMSALREGQATARTRRLPRVEITLAAEECTWLCREGQWVQAAAVAARHAFDRIVDGSLQHTVTTDKAARLGTRLGLARDPVQVVQALGPVIADAQSRGLAHREAELQLLHAAAMHRAGKVREARETLVSVSRLGQVYGYRRVFIDDAELLRPLIAQGAPSDVGWLRDILVPAAAPRVTSAAGDLTKRELRILGKLDSGLSNREIAESLFISESTLKWHLHNVYGKLDVRNRSGAIAKAKQLRVL
jgi:ATP/maltotriose-dependent transcriptional regulator MalT